MKLLTQLSVLLLHSCSFLAKGQNLVSTSLETEGFSITSRAEIEPRRVHDMSEFLNICNNLIENGNAANEDDPTYKWDAAGSGMITKENGSFIHSGRVAVSHGPSQSLDSTCFAQGLRYEYRAMLKILDNKGNSLNCEKRAPWGNFLSCPLLVMKLEFEDGGIQWVHLPNTLETPWERGRSNLYTSSFIVSKGMATAKDISVILTGPPAGRSIVFDEVGIYPQCKNMVPGGNADTTIPKNWSKWGASKTEIVPGGADGTRNSFIVSGRRRGTHGTYQVLPRHCITEGSLIEFTGQFKLIEHATKTTFECDINAPMWNPGACIYLGILLEQDGVRNWKYLENDAKVMWQKNDWNYFHRIFEITPEIVDADEVFVHIMGPRGGINIQFDEIVMTRYIPEENNCNGEMIFNGDMEGGHFAGWEAIGSANLLIDSGEPFGSRYALQSSNRRGFSDGVRQQLDMQCFLVAGKMVTIKADARVLRNNIPFACEMPDGTGAKQNDCPYFTLELTLLGGRKRNLPLTTRAVPMRDDTFQLVSNFRITEIFQWVKEVYVQIVGAAGGVTIMIDNVSILATVQTNEACSELVTNEGKTQSASKGWEVFGRGQLLFNQSPETILGDALLQGRTHHSHGLRQALDVSCFVRDERYILRANIELMDATNTPFACSRYERWGSPLYCPLFSIQLLSTGKDGWIYLPNDSPYSWRADGLNSYESILTVTNELASAEKAYLIAYGPRAGISMRIADLTLEPYEPPQNDCQEFIGNGNAESGTLDHWKIYGRCNLEVFNEGAQGTQNSFRIFNRNGFSEAIKQELVFGCLAEGARMEINGFIKLTKNGRPFTCDKTQRYGQPFVCPLFSINFVVPTARNGSIWLHVTNENPYDWEGDSFNPFRGQFVITSEMTTSTEAYLYIYGPQAGVDILLDEMSITQYQPPRTSCSQLIRNGDAASGDLDAWNVIGPGSIQFYGGDQKAYQHIGRTSPSHGPEQEINVDCLEYGKQYEITAQLKLVQGRDMIPFACDKTVQGDSPLMCPLVSLRANVMALNLVENILNDYAESWKRDEFNRYHAIFTVNHDIAASESVFFYFRGPHESVSIIFDDVEISEYLGYESDCSRLVKNGDAEETLLNGWISGGAGFYDFVEHSSGGHYFRYSRRKYRSDGPKQFLDKSCLEEGMKIDFNAKIKLEFANGEPFICNNAEQERSEIFCVDVIFEYRNFTGEKVWRRYLNTDPAVWSGDSFNDFRFTFTADEEMMSFDEVYFTITGVREDVDILFDDVSMIPFIEQRRFCAEITNGGAELGDLTGWSLYNRKGAMEIVSAGSSNAFRIYDRTSYHHGPLQEVDLSCLRPGEVFEFMFDYMLEDNQGNPLSCTKITRDNNQRCIEVAVKIEKDGTNQWLILRNDDPSPVRLGRFTGYRAEFEVSSKMIEADSVAFFLTGPRAGAVMVFDNVFLAEKSS